jgi:NADPH:quinone reductase-like Zn-dependent oxidoreductase
MKAIVWTKYGPPDVLQLQEVEKPSPKENEVLIRISATTVNAGDCEIRRFKFPLVYRIPLRILMGVVKPIRRTILGQELAGEIEAVGEKVTRFKIGDRVFAASLLRLSTYAEFICLPETYPVLKPDGITYEQAATIPTGGIYGLHLLRQANIRSGQSLMIIAAGGSIGTYAVQIAKTFGVEVTAVDSTEKLDMLRSIGADQVIDYTRGDYTRSGETYDAIIDVMGKSSFSGCIRLLKHKGVYVLGNPGIAGMVRGGWTSATTDKRVVFEGESERNEGYITLVKLIEAGKITPVIDRRYPLAQTAEAHRYFETGQKKGIIVISVAEENAEAR